MLMNDESFFSQISLHTLLEPSDRNPDDWNGSAQLAYPGTDLTGRFTTITLSKGYHYFKRVFKSFFV